MDERFNQFTAIQFVIVVGVVHFEIVELQFIFTHFGGIDIWHFHMLLNVSIFVWIKKNVKRSTHTKKQDWLIDCDNYNGIHTDMNRSVTESTIHLSGNTYSRSASILLDKTFWPWP